MSIRKEHYRNVVIGSGEAGKFLAWNLAGQGEPTIVVERGALGGACPNVACLPSKNVIHSARVASLLRRGGEYGISTSDVSIDMQGVLGRKESMIDGLADLHIERFDASGAEVVFGEGRFVEERTIAVDLRSGGTRILRGERVFIAVGTRAKLPPIPGLAETNPMTHVEMLNLQRLPEHLVVVGGGYVGLEFAQAMRRFGSRVTILERGPRLLHREDEDVSEMMAGLMRDEGIDVLCNVQLVHADGRCGQQVRVAFHIGDDTQIDTLTANDLLVAAGRTPNTDRLDASQGGIELDAEGYIRVNDRLETTAKGVWALGEVAGSPKFTHVSYDDFRVVRENLAGGNRTTTERLIPSVMFTDPQLARVGLSETETQHLGIDYRLAKIPMSAVLRTRTLSETRGFAKALVGEDDRLLGFTAFGVEASEMLAAVQTAMLARVPYTLLRDAIFAHPTIAEGLGVLLSELPKSRPMVVKDTEVSV
ncbi:FAD-dependent oxidoreductase [Novipirellula sp.]|uniref:FAD-dependent oxidoreductase n=1 Tax=Novipirellula sp. TaxID=2795430 RepID=UPI0035613ECA